MTGVKISIIGVKDPAPCEGLDPSTVDYLKLEHLAILEMGTVGGGLSVAMLGQLPNGRTVFMETTGTLFASLAAALKGAYDRFGQPWPGV